MECPQCGAEVPSDDAFCGKCGYAIREPGQERADQSVIRVHEEREPPEEEQSRPSSSSQHRIRKKTVLGMPSVSRAAKGPSPTTTPPPVPESISSGRTERTRSKTPQRTMLGMPQLERLDSGSVQSSAEESAAADGLGSAPAEEVKHARRERAHVRYDSRHETLAATEQRRKALRGLAVLVLLAAAWLGYRFFTVNG